MATKKTAHPIHDPGDNSQATSNPKTAPTTQQDGQVATNRDKDPSDWVTGDEPMTGAQASYLKTLSEQAKEPFDAKLSKGDASRRIDALKKRVGV